MKEAAAKNILSKITLGDKTTLEELSKPLFEYCKLVAENEDDVVECVKEGAYLIFYSLDKKSVPEFVPVKKQIPRKSNIFY